jgi:hypothetical protein
VTCILNTRLSRVKEEEEWTKMTARYQVWKWWHEAGRVAQVVGCLLASARPWVQAPGPPNKKRKEIVGIRVWEHTDITGGGLNHTTMLEHYLAVCSKAELSTQTQFYS